MSAEKDRPLTLPKVALNGEGARFSAEDVRVALRRHYGIASSDFFAEEWSLLDEVAIKAHGWTEARIDCLAVRCWSGMPKGHERIAIEIKVDRADFRREMESQKWRTWHRIAHRFAFVVPGGLVTVDDVPAECGLAYVTSNGVRWLRQPPRHDPEPMPEAVFAEVCRRLSRHEERLRRGSVDDPAAEIASLRLEVKRLTAQVTASDARVDRHRKHVEQLMQDLGAAATCECGRPVKYHRGKHHWLHSDVPTTEPTSRYCEAEEVKRWGAWARPALESAQEPSEVEAVNG